MSLISAPGGQNKQISFEFETSLVYIVSSKPGRVKGFCSQHRTLKEIKIQKTDVQRMLAPFRGQISLSALEMMPRTKQTGLPLL